MLKGSDWILFDNEAANLTTVSVLSEGKKATVMLWVSYHLIGGTASLLMKAITAYAICQNAKALPQGVDQTVILTGALHG